MEFLNAFSHLDWAQVLHLTWQHITLVGIAVTLAILVGVPLGILMTRFPTLAGPLQASATVLLTISCGSRPVLSARDRTTPSPAAS